MTRDQASRDAIILKELRRAYAAMERVAELNCGCETGGGMGDLDPGFTCGYHKLLDQIAQMAEAWGMTRNEKLREAAIEYVEETDYIDNMNRNIAGNAFMAGAAYQREQDAELMLALEEGLEEMAKPPFRDSDLTSLISWINARASALLAAVRKAKGEE